MEFTGTRSSTESQLHKEYTLHSVDEHTQNISEFIDLMVPGICDWNFESLIGKHIIRIKFMKICEIPLRWIPRDTSDYM